MLWQKFFPNIIVCIFMATKHSFIFAELKVHTVTNSDTVLKALVTAFCSKP